MCISIMDFFLSYFNYSKIENKCSICKKELTDDTYIIEMSENNIAPKIFCEKCLIDGEYEF